MEEIQFFNDLLRDTWQVFRESPIKQYQDREKKNWNYAICETPIQKGKGLIFGLNWGGENDYPAQKNYPSINKGKRNWPFISTSRKYFKKHIGIESINQINYSNLCFFRSPKIKYLKERDWELALPLFEKYVNYIKPTWTLMLGNTGINYLGNHLTITDRIKVNGKGRKVKGYKGVLFGKYKFKCVPHPNNYRFNSSEKIDELWAKVFSD